MTKRKSRYLTFRAAIQSAGPTLVRSDRKTNIGRKTTCQVGTKPYHNIRPIRITRLTRKSTNATSMVARGAIRRGKYTLVMRWALLTMLAEPSLNTDENKYHGSMPAK